MNLKQQKRLVEGVTVAMPGSGCTPTQNSDSDWGVSTGFPSSVVVSEKGRERGRVVKSRYLFEYAMVKMIIMI